MSASGRRSGSSGALRATRPSASGGYAEPRSSSSSAAVKEAVAEAPSPAMAGVTRPGARESNTRRRPAPKVITDGAVQLSSPSNADGPRRPLSDFGGGYSSSPKAAASPTAQVASGSQDTGGYPGDSSSAKAATFLPPQEASTPPVVASAPPVAQPSQDKTLMGIMQAQNDLDGNSNPHCTISTDGDAGAEIRTKVFRMGAPLLRSTIPVSLSSPRGEKQKLDKASKIAKAPRAHNGENDDSDVETVHSLSDLECEDQGVALSVTLDFPC